MHHDIEEREIDAPGTGSTAEQEEAASLRDMFARFSEEMLAPLAALSGMQMAAIIDDDEGIFPKSAPGVCLASRLESKTRTVCRRSHRELRSKVRETLPLERNTCPFGLELFCLPVTLNGRLYGFIEGGRVFRNHPAPDDTVEPIKRVLRRSRWSAWLQALSESYPKTAVVKKADVNLWIRVLSALAETLALKVAALEGAKSEAQHPGILKALAYIRQHLDEPLTPAVVARAANVSENYFSKLFKRGTGMHFSEFLARERIKEACTLLLETEQNVCEIAFAVGFDSVPYFNRCFKALTKTSPSLYRLDRTEASLLNRNDLESLTAEAQ